MNDAPETLTPDRHRLLKEHLMNAIAGDPVSSAPRSRRHLGWLAAPPLVVGLAAAVTLVVPGQHPADRHAVVAPAAAPSRPATPLACPPTAAASTAASSAASTAAATAEATDPAGQPAPQDPVPALAAAARAAAAKPAPDVKDNQFVYTRTLQRIDGGPACVRKVWNSADGRSEGLIIDPRGGTMRYSANPQGQPPSLAAPTYRYLASLPTDPQSLLLLVHAGTQDNGKDKDTDPNLVAFRKIEDLLITQLMPPAVGGAFCQATTAVPGVTVVSDAVDLLGRHGIGVTGSDGTDRVEMIFDRDTCEYLGNRRTRLVDTQAQGGLRAGAVSEEAVVLRTVTDRAGQESEG